MGPGTVSGGSGSSVLKESVNHMQVRISDNYADK